LALVATVMIGAAGLAAVGSAEPHIVALLAALVIAGGWFSSLLRQVLRVTGGRPGRVHW